MDIDQQNRYNELRGISKTRPLTLEESREIISLLREGRISSALIKKSTKKTSSKVAVDSDKLLEDF